MRNVERFTQQSRIAYLRLHDTHTPVDAGHHKFPHELVTRVLGAWVAVMKGAVSQRAS